MWGPWGADREASRCRTGSYIPSAPTFRGPICDRPIATPSWGRRTPTGNQNTDHGGGGRCATTIWLVFSLAIPANKCPWAPGGMSATCVVKVDARLTRDRTAGVRRTHCIKRYVTGDAYPLHAGQIRRTVISMVSRPQLSVRSNRPANADHVTSTRAQCRTWRLLSTSRYRTFRAVSLSLLLICDNTHTFVTEKQKANWLITWLFL